MEKESKPTLIQVGKIFVYEFITTLVNGGVGAFFEMPGCRFVSPNVVWQIVHAMPTVKILEA